MLFTTQVMECSVRSLQISWTVHSKTFQIHLNDMSEFKYKFIERGMKWYWEGGQNTKFSLQKHDICVTFTHQTSQPKSLTVSIS